MTADDTMLQDPCPPPVVTDEDRRKMRGLIAARSLATTPDRPAAVSRCRELLDALGLAPTTPTGGTG
jgi:hypothetical protein